MKVIITGVTGMVGEGVLHEALQRNEVTEILVLGRKSYGLTHPKLKEVIHANFHDLTSIEEQLKGYDACFFCLGVSSVGMKEPEYRKLTYDLTLHVASTLSRLNSAMTFCYISGAGTDSSEKGNSMWARVKGKTENDLTKLPFKHVYNFRPAFIVPTKGLKNTLKLYKYVGWLIPVIKTISPNYIVSLKDLGQAMVNVVLYGYDKTVLEVSDIRKIAASR
jgi:uncharacterized protein YbjT (DUF2867 family)